jgi:hypothetical protein
LALLLVLSPSLSFFSALEALRDYTKEQVEDRKGPLTLCDRSFVEHLNELIRGERLKEQRLFHGITGIVPDPE